MKMAIIVANHAAHQVSTANALVDGLRVHGDEAEIFHSKFMFDARRSEFDAVAVWGWRRGIQYRDVGMNVLIMERAYVADRFHWISLGWNGLNGRAEWPDITDSRRWDQFFTENMKPWRMQRGYALLLGQVPSDTACIGIDIQSFFRDIAGTLRGRGEAKDVRFRPHPGAPNLQISNAKTARGTLEECLESAAVAITYNSNSGVDAVLAGVPTITYDAGSMAWDVTSHDLMSAVITPDRTEWAARLAWRQWLPYEIHSGYAWSIVKGALK